MIAVLITFAIGISIGILKGFVDGTTSHPNEYQSFIEKYNWLYKLGVKYRGLFPKDEWKNKYKNGNPKQGEAFFGSTTFLVFLTDKFHLVSFLVINGIMLLVAIQSICAAIT